MTANVVVYDEAKNHGDTLSESGFAVKISEFSLDRLFSKFRAINERRVQQGLSLLVLAIPLSACGGSDSTPATEVTGRAIDGYLANSKVFLTSNPDVFVQTSNEAGQQGTFSGLFGSGSIVVQGGTDISTGKTFTGELRAPEGATVVTHSRPLWMPLSKKLWRRVAPPFLWLKRKRKLRRALAYLKVQT